MMRGLQKTIVAAILLFAAVANAKDHFPWAASYEAARAQAARENKPLLLHFWSLSCVPCRHVEKYVFSHPGVGKMVGKKYIPVKINTDERPDLARQFRIESIPHDVFLSADGRELQRASSPTNQRAYLQLVTRVAENAETTAQGTLSQLSKVAREQNGPRYDPKTGKFQNAPAYYPSPSQGKSATPAAANQPITPPPGYQASGYQGSGSRNSSYEGQGSQAPTYQNAGSQPPTGNSQVVHNPQFKSSAGPPAGSANSYPPPGNSPVNNPYVQAPPTNGRLFGAPSGAPGGGERVPRQSHPAHPGAVRRLPGRRTAPHRRLPVRGRTGLSQWLRSTVSTALYESA